MPRCWICAVVAGAMFIAGGCDRATPSKQASAGKPKAGAAGVDAQMAAKIAEAKARFDKLSPAERKKLEAEFAKARTTMPLDLREAGSITLRRPGQAPILLASLAPAGTPTLIAAWASWCVPCKVEARELARLRALYRPDQLAIAYLNVGEEKVEAAKGPQFLRESGAEGLGLNLIARKDFLRLTRVDQVSVPRVLAYDRAGKPVQVIVGGIAGGPDPRIAAAVKQILGS